MPRRVTHLSSPCRIGSGNPPRPPRGRARQRVVHPLLPGRERACQAQGNSCAALALRAQCSAKAREISSSAGARGSIRWVTNASVHRQPARLHPRHPPQRPCGRTDQPEQPEHTDTMVRLKITADIPAAGGFSCLTKKRPAVPAAWEGNAVADREVRPV